MAEEEKPSLWELALNTYRDVEVVKRSQPLLVQGIQQVQTPLSRNNEAIVQTGGGAMASILPTGSNSLLFMGLGLVAAVGLVLVLKRRKR